MLRSLRRIAVAAGIAAAALALTAAPSQAADPNTGYQPSAADFANCPTLPAGVNAATWTCYTLTIVSGDTQLNQEGAVITTPVQMTVAEGTGTLGGKQAFWGGIAHGGPMAMEFGIPNSIFTTPEPHGWQIQFQGTGYVKPGLIIPAQFGLKAVVTGAGLGDGCTIGSDTHPVILRPELLWLQPNVINGVGVITARVSSIFELPTSGTCSAASQVLLNTFMQLPAVATANHLNATFAVRSKKY